jgi:hypothetical protein
LEDSDGTPPYYQLRPSLKNRTFVGFLRLFEKIIRYISDDLYFIISASIHSYYCPQAPVVRNYFPDEARWWISAKKPLIMKAPEFIKRFEEMKLRYVIILGLQRRGAGKELGNMESGRILRLNKESLRQGRPLGSPTIWTRRLGFWSLSFTVP